MTRHFSLNSGVVLIKKLLAENIVEEHGTNIHRNPHSNKRISDVHDHGTSNSPWPHSPPRKLSANRLAINLGVPSGRVTDILNSRRSITADTALRLALYFGNRAQFWLDLQSQNDIAIVEREHGEEIKKRVHSADAA